MLYPTESQPVRYEKSTLSKKEEWGLILLVQNYTTLLELRDRDPYSP